jgi:hypothetical protein
VFLLVFSRVKTCAVWTYRFLSSNGQVERLIQSLTMETSGFLPVPDEILEVPPGTTQACLTLVQSQLPPSSCVRTSHCLVPVIPTLLRSPQAGVPPRIRTKSSCSLDSFCYGNCSSIYPRLVVPRSPYFAPSEFAYHNEVPYYCRVNWMCDLHFAKPIHVTIWIWCLQAQTHQILMLHVTM